MVPNWLLALLFGTLFVMSSEADTFNVMKGDCFTMRNLDVVSFVWELVIDREADTLRTPSG